jgi:hypothetical protein
MCDAEGLAHRRVTDGRAKRVRASDVDRAWRSYSPSFKKKSVSMTGRPVK